MDLLSPNTIKEILSRHNAIPLKQLGQNFLINRGVLEKIIKAADLQKSDIALEIGPGIGTLTQELAKTAKKVIAIEKDKKMVGILKETLKDFKNTEIIEGDILKIKNYKIKNYKLVANLPYYITSPVIKKFLEAKNQPKDIILTVQKEVAQRICATPPDMSLLAVSVQFFADPKILSFVSSGSFWPQPKIDSAILRITPKAKLPKINQTLFFKIVKAGFSAPRKQIAGNFVKKLEIDREVVLGALKKAQIKPEQRAETLSLPDWIKISLLFSTKNSRV